MNSITQDQEQLYNGMRVGKNGIAISSLYKRVCGVPGGTSTWQKFIDAYKIAILNLNGSGAGKKHHIRVSRAEADRVIIDAKAAPFGPKLKAMNARERRWKAAAKLKAAEKLSALPQLELTSVAAAPEVAAVAPETSTIPAAIIATEPERLTKTVQSPPQPQPHFSAPEPEKPSRRIMAIVVVENPDDRILQAAQQVVALFRN